MIYRLYFNRCEDFPQMWSIDEGSVETEVNVIGVRSEGHVTFATGHAADASALDRRRDPVAWIEVDAHALSIEAGVAVFRTVGCQTDTDANSSGIVPA